MSPKNLGAGLLLKGAVLVLIILISSSITFNCILVVAFLTSTRQIPSFGTIGLISPLHIEGRYVMDNYGNVVVLKGVQKHGFEDDAGGRWKDETGTYFNRFTESVVRRNLQVMRSWGANELRVFDRVRFWQENTPDSNGMPHRDIISRLIEIAGEEGLYVVYCLFSMDAGSGHHGVPWGTTQIPTRADFVDLWVDIATELGRYPNVLFELWNEVVRSRDDWFTGCNETIRAVRGVADNIIIIQWDWDVWYREGQYEGVCTLDWVNDPRIQGQNVLFSTHMYRDAKGFYLYEDGTEDIFYTYEDVGKAFVAEKVQECVETWNKPLYVGEYGPSRTGTEALEPHELESCDNGLSLLDGWGISYNVMWWWIGMAYRLFTETDNRVYYDDPAYITEWGSITRTHLSSYS